ncbi:MAG: phosphoribosylglycinamide formyltransferase [Elusimicrobiota bacterium]
MPDSSNKKRIAVLISGNGTNMQAIVDACKSGEINGEVVVVVSNQRYAYGLQRARESQIETLLFEAEKFSTRTLFCSKLAKALNEKNVDLVCLAGYLLKIEPCMIRSFPNRIINIHPSLLPKYGGKGMYGRHVHEAVLKNGETESGCTVHLVNEVFDEGPILAQAKVKVLPSDTPESLAEKIHPEEHKLYVRVLKDICNEKIDLDKFSEGVKK